MISLVVAMSNSRVIGVNNKLPWSIPEDLEYFRQLTLNSPIIMGRKTHESIGRKLSQRRNIVISRNTSYKPSDGCFSASSIEDAITIANENNPEEIFVIGGEEIYHLTVPMAKRIYVTQVDIDIEGDAYFPEFENDPDWSLVYKTLGLYSNSNTSSYTFNVYEKNHEPKNSNLADSYTPVMLRMFQSYTREN